MSIKKTWFSYILWLVATGFSVFFIYSGVKDVINYYGWYCAGELWGYVGFSIVFLILFLGICFILGFSWKKISNAILPEWLDKGVSVLSAMIALAIFAVSRFLFMMQASLETEQAMIFFENSKIGGVTGQTENVVTIFEQVYTSVLSVVFLFFGNKPEMMLYFQVLLQVLTLLLLMVIGWILQKGICAWIPAILYAGAPLFASAVTNVGPTNFWLFVVVVLSTVIGILESVWKDKKITYYAVVIWGVVFAAYTFMSNRFLLGNTNGTLISTPAQFYTELLIAFLLVFYCVSFWYEDTDNGSLYIGAAGLFFLMTYVLTPMQSGMESILMLLMNLYLSFAIAEGVLVFFAANTKTDPSLYYDAEDDDDDEEDEDEVFPQRTAEIVPIIEKKTSAEAVPVGLQERMEEPVIASLSENLEEKMVLNRSEQKEEREALGLSEPIEENMPTSKSTFFDWYDKNEQQEFTINQNIDKLTETEVLEISDINETKVLEEENVFEEEKTFDKVDFLEENKVFEERMQVESWNDLEKMAESDELEDSEDSEEPVVIRVSDILKNVGQEEGDVCDTQESNVVIDKTAMIENVLPMPKKHVSRTLDYAFEPSEDMMHYDVEIENDDYDYE